MIRPLWSWCVLIGCICCASGRADEREDPAKLPSPANPGSFPSSQQDAARAVAVALRERGEKPGEFHAQVVTEDAGNVLVFHLWHDSALTKQNRQAPGNPGGKCRDAYYDRRKKQVAKMLFWQ